MRDINTSGTVVVRQSGEHASIQVVDGEITLIRTSGVADLLKAPWQRVILIAWLVGAGLLTGGATALAASSLVGKLLALIP